MNVSREARLCIYMRVLLCTLMELKVGYGKKKKSNGSSSSDEIFSIHICSSSLIKSNIFRVQYIWKLRSTYRSGYSSHTVDPTEGILSPTLIQC